MKPSFANGCCCTAAVLMFVNAANAQDAPIPTDAQLRAGYCIPIVRMMINSVTEGAEVFRRSVNESGERYSTLVADDANASDIASAKAEHDHWIELETETEHAVTRFKTTLNRLQLYIVPVLMNGDATAIALASARGDADIKAMKSLSLKCADLCNAPNSAPHLSQECKTECPDADVLERIRPCLNPTWLPF